MITLERFANTQEEKPERIHGVSGIAQKAVPKKMTKTRMLVITCIWTVVGLLIANAAIDRQYEQMLHPMSTISVETSALQSTQAQQWMMVVQR